MPRERTVPHDLTDIIVSFLNGEGADGQPVIVGTIDSLPFAMLRIGMAAQKDAGRVIGALAETGLNVAMPRSVVLFPLEGADLPFDLDFDALMSAKSLQENRPLILTRGDEYDWIGGTPGQMPVS